MPSVNEIVSKEKFFLQITNNTSQTLPVVLFDFVGAYNGVNAIPGDIPKYTYDLTPALNDAIAKSLNTVAVLAAPYNTGIYELFTAINIGSATFTTAAQIVSALNTMGIGQFNIVAGNTIEIISRQYILSSISTTSPDPALHSTTFGTNFTLGGSLIYDPGYTSGLIGSFTQIDPGNSFWINTLSDFEGPYNRTNIYANKNDDIDRSFFANIYSAIAKTVYVGFSFSNRNGLNNNSSFAYLYLNNNKIVDVSSNAMLTALASDVNTQLSTAYTAAEITYTCWFIIPVQLQAGNNLLQMIDFNNNAVQMNVAGLEVYDNTFDEIKDATSYSQLNLLFSSIDYLNKPLF